MNRFAVSNIGWDASWEDEVLDFLPGYGFTGIEVAPTKVWGAWDEIDIKHVKRYKRRLDDYGIAVPAFQSIFFWKT